MNKKRITKMKGLLLLGVLFLTVFAAVTAILAPPTASEPQASANTAETPETTPEEPSPESITIKGLQRATNEAREQNNLKPLKLDGRLNTSAQAKCEHMAEHDYWEHIAPDGTTAWDFISRQIKYRVASENLSYGFETEEEVIETWMESPVHGANILSMDHSIVGFGVCYPELYQQQEGQIIVVQHLALPSL